MITLDCRTLKTIAVTLPNAMLFASLPRRLVCLALLVAGCLGLGGARAQSVGTVVQAIGDARIADQAAALGVAVQQGQQLTTGAESFLYIKTLDGGFLILRPGSTAQIITYQIDAVNPSNSQFKLELSKGVARNISGSAVKSARQNFRFNTPVAAIGVRGTDFTVYADDQLTRVSVLTGGVVVSGFGGGCSPQGGGPCESADKRELFASQAGQMLQVLRGQILPQLISSSALEPDKRSPPRSDEPTKPDAGARAPAPAVQVAAVSKEPLLLGSPVLPDAHRPVNLTSLISALAVVVPAAEVVPAVVVPAAVVPAAVVVVPAPAVPALVWGRWQPLADSAAPVDLVAILSAGQTVGVNSFFAIARRTDAPWQSPASGSVSFSLDSAQALVRSDATGAASVVPVQNASLGVNFGSSTFATKLDLVLAGQTSTLRAEGTVGKDGLFGNGFQFAPGSNMTVQGALANHGSGARAAYVFQSRLDSANTAFGITNWSKP